MLRFDIEQKRQTGFADLEYRFLCYDTSYQWYFLEDDQVLLSNMDGETLLIDLAAGVLKQRIPNDLQYDPVNCHLYGRSGSFHLYTIDELIAYAHEVVGKGTLSEQERRRYNIS